MQTHELESIAQALVPAGKGILAADEGDATIKRRSIASTSNALKQIAAPIGRCCLRHRHRRIHQWGYSVRGDPSSNSSGQYTFS